MTEPQLSVDTLFDLLKNRRRRYLLYCLDREADSVATLDELAASVLDWERQMDAGVEEPRADRKRRIRIALHHKHLPKLAELGLVEYDSRSETVRICDGSSVVAFAEDHHDEVPHLRSLFCTSPASDAP